MMNGGQVPDDSVHQMFLFQRIILTGTDKAPASSNRIASQFNIRPRQRGGGGRGGGGGGGAGGAGGQQQQQQQQQQQANQQQQNNFNGQNHPPADNEIHPPIPHNAPLPPAQAPNNDPVPREDNQHVPAGLAAEAHRLMRRARDRQIRFAEPHERDL